MPVNVLNGMNATTGFNELTVLTRSLTSAAEINETINTKLRFAANSGGVLNVANRLCDATSRTTVRTARGCEDVGGRLVTGKLGRTSTDGVTKRGTDRAFNCGVTVLSVSGTFRGGLIRGVLGEGGSKFFGSTVGVDRSLDVGPGATGAGFNGFLRSGA